MASNPVPKLTEEQYLAIERAAPVKSEFINGEMFAMAGGTFPHATLQSNLQGELFNSLRGSGCRVVGSDLRVKVESTGLHTYPDGAVVCGDPVFADGVRDTLVNPTVLFEVLSPSSENYDRGEKSQNYRMIPALTDYILVSQKKMYVEQLTRQADGTWQLREYTRPEQTLTIESIGVSIPLANIYAAVEFSA
jgi:Uma2 family endonuclease